ncbi:NAD(P)H-hydrate dehydratase [Mycetocola manganoxydans]|uniref:ADP-dependent (S)-NAD(P)H-hydrate dehydratase n=1 Tax=Mycetocola manganoxydans TaxID=699879 RepID=A0A3L6ZZE9_9MICO|nr:NAD(P)H-hydrate dehydratase [Mycetocola manganoxydans]RLP73108.1 NAD(P)H-hydrate dehydratase [Mycetocola manganoxydans]GHD44065.1 ADP-dependent (S)-NAD(P)H-hydrate dehydratase [Mycetocola manganoxydans]
MSSLTEHQVTPNALRDWPLPAAGDSKYGRGQVLIVGGAQRSPGAAMLSGLAALRVGAGRLTLAVAASVATAVAVAVPECGVVPLDETPAGAVSGSALGAAERDLSRSDAVLIGPGLDDPDELERMLSEAIGLIGAETVVVLDAFALGVLPKLPGLVDAFGGRLVLTPNKEEAARLLERDLDDLVDGIAEIARRYSAVVTCYDVIAHPDGRIWRTGTGGGGLATSGSGDVLAGAITGLCARGASLEQAAVWATHTHAAAGDRLAVPVGPLGFLASELLDELPRVLVEIGA